MGGCATIEVIKNFELIIHSSNRTVGTPPARLGDVRVTRHGASVGGIVPTSVRRRSGIAADLVRKSATTAILVYRARRDGTVISTFYGERSVSFDAGQRRCDIGVSGVPVGNGSSSCVNGVVGKATAVDSGSGRRTSVVTKRATEWC